MSTLLGSTAHKTSGTSFWYGSGYPNQFARKLTMPAGGPYLISRAGAWFTGKDIAATAKIVIWSFSSGAVLGQSASFNCANEAFGHGNSNSHENDMVSPFVVAGGTVLLVGFARDPDEAAQFDTENSVTQYNRIRTTWPGSMAGYSTDSDAPGAWLYYDLANTLPGAPTLTAPADGSRQITATPVFTFSHNDVDGDPCASYDLQVDDSNGFGSPIWDDVNDTTGISGNNITRTYAGGALTRGVTYYWRCRTNDGVGDGTWSATRSFKYNALPTIAMNAPASAALGVIHNIADLALWTSGGTDAKCQFKWTPSDADGDTLTKYQLRIYNDNAGVKGTLLYDSGQVALSQPTGVQVTLNATQGLVNGTQYWWSIDVYDGYEWAGESTATKFKVRWAQGLYEFDTTATSLSYTSFATGTKAQTVAICFGSSTGAARTGTVDGYDASIATLTPYRYFQALVRLTTATAGSGATLADMTFGYYGALSTPDGWVVS